MRTPRSILATTLLAVVVTACSTAAPTPAATAAPSTSASSAAPTSSAIPATDAASSASGSLACTAPATATLAETEGPYYKAGAPESSDLTTADMGGTRLTLTGYVVTTDCSPVAGAKVEIWQADSSGSYDNSGYTLRGYVLTDASGQFTIRTVVPGEYPGRTEHIHVKVTPPGGTTLTTQVYFPGTTANDSDGIYDPSLLLAITQDGDALIGSYTFVVAA